MSKAFVFLAQGFEEIEAVTAIDVLRRAGIIVETVSVTGTLQVAGSHGISLVADLLFEAADFSEGMMLILPGGMPGALNLNSHQGLGKLILDYHQGGKFIGAICAAPLVLGKLGILDNKKATCYPGFESYLQGAIIMKDPVVTDRNVLTGNGAGSAMEFALKAVALLEGNEKAGKVAEKMVVRTD
jgi:4-methyl-5(b-hydroxyethyl)-thiazole monophosphate biosynthesis